MYPRKFDASISVAARNSSHFHFAMQKTIHTFQGQNAGPVQPNQPPNPIQRIICDPGNKEFEGRNPGLFYTTFARATTLGNDKMSSAIYFKGPNMTPDRVMNMRVGRNGRLFKCPRLIDQWV